MRIASTKRSKISGSAFLLLMILAFAGAPRVAIAAADSPGSALERSVDFHIDAQALASGLLEFSDQSGIQVVSRTSLVSGSYTQGVHGRLSIREGLNHLLDQTGLSYVVNSDRTISVVNATSATSSVVHVAANTSPVDVNDTTAFTPPDSGIPDSTPPPGQTTVQKPTAVELGSVSVTGTRIKRANFDTLETMSTTTSQEMQIRGFTNVLQALQASPMFGVPDSSAIGSSQGALSIGQSFADLFGLGSQRTLTLVNGYRFVSSNAPGVGGTSAPPGSQVDLNVIPIALIDHVDTIAIGGAPVYGSDAIAGTVNVVLKDHFQGVQALAQHGLSSRHDAENNLYSLLIGGNFDDNRGNATVAVQYSHQEPLMSSDRFGWLFPLPNPAYTGPGSGVPANIFAPDIHLPYTTEGGLPYDGSAVNVPGVHIPNVYPNGNFVFNSSGQPLQFAPNGQLVPFNAGTIVQDVSLGGGATLPAFSSGGDGVNMASTFPLLIESTRTIVGGVAHYDLAPNLTAFTNVTYAHTEGILPNDLTAFVVPAILPGPNTLTFSANNPYLSAQDQQILQANGLSSFNLSRNLSDILERNPWSLNENLYQIATGLKGSFPLFAGTWTWNATYNYGMSRGLAQDSYIDTANFLAAADAVRDSSGNIVCKSGGSCVPIDLFGENAFSNAAASYVTDIADTATQNTLRDIEANVSGPLPLAIAALDPIQVNLGAERRTESASTAPDATALAGLVFNGLPGISAISGSITNTAAYGEALVPLVSDHSDSAWVQRASVDLAARHVNNSQSGGAWTWSAGGQFAPKFSGLADGLSFRGVYMHAIRTPSITELFVPETGGLFPLNDPCDASSYNSGPDPAVREKNCASALAAAGAPPPGQFRATTASISPTGFTTGDPQLQPETAKSWSLGTVYQPTAAPNFRISLDWDHILLNNGITSLAIGDILDACYDSTNYPANAACGRFSRLTAAQATAPRVAGDIANGFTQGFINAATFKLSGAMLAAQYVQPLAGGQAGRLNVRGSVFFSDHFQESDFAGQPATEIVGMVGYPKFRATLDVGYKIGRFDTDWQVRWNSALLLNNTATPDEYPTNSFPSYKIYNATFGYDITDSVRLEFVVDDVFNAGLPEVGMLAQNFAAFDPIGRRYLLQLSANTF